MMTYGVRQQEEDGAGIVAAIFLGIIVLLGIRCEIEKFVSRDIQPIGGLKEFETIQGAKRKLNDVLGLVATASRKDFSATKEAVETLAEPHDGLYSHIERLYSAEDSLIGTISEMCREQGNYRLETELLDEIYGTSYQWPKLSPQKRSPVIRHLVSVCKHVVFTKRITIPNLHMTILIKVARNCTYGDFWHLTKNFWHYHFRGITRIAGEKDLELTCARLLGNRNG